MSNLTLGGIATHVRAVMDVDTTDVPDSLFEVWAREISVRIQNAHKRWPFRQASWTFTTTPDVASYAFTDISEAGSDVRQVSSVIDPDNTVLDWVSTDEADTYDLTNSSASSTRRYTVWAESVVIYPTPSEAETFTVRGYRNTNDWVADGTGGVPDFPDDFDQVIVNWCLGRAYWQQEDPEMGQPLMDLADSELTELVAKYPDEPIQQPLVIGGARRASRFGRLRYSWE